MNRQPSLTEECTLTFEPPARQPASPDAQTEEIQREAATPMPASPRGGPRLARTVIRGLFREAEEQMLYGVRDLEGFRDAWSITLKNATRCANPVLAGVACVLLDAAGRLAPGELVEGVISVDGHAHEVWVDTGRLVLLAAIPRPDLDVAAEA